jgi:hypothetical protein
LQLHQKHSNIDKEWEFSRGCVGNAKLMCPCLFACAFIPSALKIWSSIALLHERNLKLQQIPRPRGTRMLRITHLCSARSARSKGDDTAPGFSQTDVKVFASLPSIFDLPSWICCTTSVHALEVYNTKSGRDRIYFSRCYNSEKGRTWSPFVGYIAWYNRPPPMNCAEFQNTSPCTRIRESLDGLRQCRHCSAVHVMKMQLKAHCYQTGRICRTQEPKRHLQNIKRVSRLKGQELHLSNQQTAI